MKACRISVCSKAELLRELEIVGANSASLPFFENKRETVVLLVDSLPCAAANILKQEMLSVGGDAAVHAHAVDCKAETSKAILFGNKKQLKEVAAKLHQMPWWNFSQLADGIESCISEQKTVRTKLMGIINLTEDSFFADSRISVSCVREYAQKLAEEGADILDLGAESTRSGAKRVDESVEAERILTAISAIREKLPEIPISVDTTRSAVAKAALEQGANIINDISGLTFDENIASVCAEHNAKYVLTHIKGTPENMDEKCEYENLLLDIANFFERQIDLAEKHGLKRENIILDPGFGFAKTHEQNRYLLKNLCAFRSFNLPLLAGVSRKRFLGENLLPEERLEASLAAATICAQQGVEYLRVHDVAKTRRVINFCEILR